DAAEEPAIRQVVAGGDMPRADRLPHEVAVAPLDAEIDRRRWASFAALDLAQIERAAEVAAGLPDQDQRIAVLLQREVDRIASLRDQAHSADHRRWQDR